MLALFPFLRNREAVSAAKAHRAGLLMSTPVLARVLAALAGHSGIVLANGP
jgi:hypothetical protein